MMKDNYIHCHFILLNEPEFVLCYHWIVSPINLRATSLEKRLGTFMLKLAICWMNNSFWFVNRKAILLHVLCQNLLAHSLNIFNYLFGFWLSSSILYLLAHGVLVFLLFFWISLMKGLNVSIKLLAWFVLHASCYLQKTSSSKDVFQLFAEKVRDNKKLESRWAIMQETRVEYFRGKDITIFLRNHPEVKQILDSDKDLEVEDIVNTLLMKNLLVRCDRVVKTIRPGKKKLSSWPAHLQIHSVSTLLTIDSNHMQSEYFVFFSPQYMSSSTVIFKHYWDTQAFLLP